MVSFSGSQLEHWQECRGDWTKKQLFHMDGWLGPDISQKGTTNCETTLSVNNVTFIVDPPSECAPSSHCILSFHSHIHHFTLSTFMILCLMDETDAI